MNNLKDIFIENTVKNNLRSPILNIQNKEIVPTESCD